MNTYELEEIWEGFTDAAVWTNELQLSEEDEEYPHAEWNSQVEYGNMRVYVDSFAGTFEQDIRLAVAMSPWGFAGIGHDLWMTAQGHGCGFWDRGYGKLGERLTVAAKQAGLCCDAYVGDDGVAYFSGFEPSQSEI